MFKHQTALIAFAMILGVIAGLATHGAVDAPTATMVASYFHLPADIFLHLTKMIIAPLVFGTLVTGVAHMRDGNAIGRIGARAMLWFLVASLISLTLGLILVNLFAPGAGLGMAPTDPVQPGAGNPGFRAFVLHIFPTSMIGAMAENEVLQVVVVSLFVGVGLASLGDRAERLLALIEDMTELMLRITTYVMRFAPLAVFGAIASALALKGVDIIGQLGRLVAEFYVGLGLFWMLLATICVIGIGTKRGLRLLTELRQPLLLAFSTASSEAAYPKLLEQLDRFGVPRRISGFVLPLGYSFNLDGSMMYASFATIFIAQAYGIELDAATQITILLVLMVTSKGIAGVPRASLVIVAATLSQFGLPVEGVGLILAVDHFMDMGRTATNVMGNAVATVIVATWEQGEGPVPEVAETMSLDEPMLPSP